MFIYSVVTIAYFVILTASSLDLQVVLTPGPTVLVKEGSQMMFKCKAATTFMEDWFSTLFYDESFMNGTSTIGGFYNKSNSCDIILGVNSSLYTYDCNETSHEFKLNIKEISVPYNDKSIKCQVQYGNGNAQTDLFVWAETKVQISANYRISVSPGTLYFGGNVSAILTCMTTDDSIAVRWWKNVTTIAVIYQVDENGHCKFSGSYDTRYRYECDPVNRKYYLTIPPREITYNDLQTEWRCGFLVGHPSDPITFNIIDLPQLLLPKLSEFTSSNTMKLNCTINSTYTGYNKADKWVHTNGGKVIRTLDGIVDGKSFILQVPFCNYQDIGDYTCVWKSDLVGLETMKATTKVQISGPPVISGVGHNVYTMASNLTIYMAFYSVPVPKDPIWLFDNKTINYGSKYSKTTIVSAISLILHDISAEVGGYVTKLIIRNTTATDVGVYTCILENGDATVIENIKVMDRTKDNSLTSDVGSGEQFCSAGLIGGVAFGCIVVTFILTLTGHFAIRWFILKRKGTVQRDTSEKINSSYDELGMQSLPSVYDIIQT